MPDINPPNGHGVTYWEVVRRRFEAGDEGDQKFHEAMVKDAENVSNVGVLIMPLAFAGLTTMPYPDEKGHSLFASAHTHEQEYTKVAVRLLYTFCLTLAIGLSSVGTLTAMRTSLMLSAQPPGMALQLLKNLDNLRERRRGAWARKWYPFRAIRLAVKWLLVAVLLVVESQYGLEETVLASIVLGVMYRAWEFEDVIHGAVQVYYDGPYRGGSAEERAQMEAGL